MCIDSRTEAIPIAGFVYAFLQCQFLADRYLIAILTQCTFKIGCITLFVVFFSIVQLGITFGKLNGFVQFHQA